MKEQGMLAEKSPIWEISSCSRSIIYVRLRQILVGTREDKRIESDFDREIKRISDIINTNNDSD